MIKNSDDPKTVSVINENGEIIGTTYSKRAKGLVKKCRAVYVSDNMIRLNDCPTYNDNTEEFMMDLTNKTSNNIAEITTDTEKKYLYFNPREWKVSPSAEESTNFERFFIGDPFVKGGFTEIASMGTWNGDWCEIKTGMLKLEKNTEYHFVFWLNGGENDRCDEVCSFHVISAEGDVEPTLEEWNAKLNFRLNRSYISPVKHFSGWELYDIPVVTGDKEFTQLCFTAMNAPMALMHADKPEAYESFPDEVDEFANERPQRHNITCDGGWPAKAWYSTKNLRNGKKRSPLSKKSHVADGNCDSEEIIKQAVAKAIRATHDIPVNIANTIASKLESRGISVEIDDLADEIFESVDDAVLDEDFDSDDISDIVDDLVDDFIEEMKDRLS